MGDCAVIRKKYSLLKPTMGERARRLWAGAEADAIGYGGVALLARASGLAISTVRKGRDEVRAGASLSDVVQERRPGAGRSRLEKKNPELTPALENLVDPATRGDPESPLRWTCKSVRTLARELTKAGHRVSPQKVSSLLRDRGYSLRGTSRVKEGKEHPDRNAQFEHIYERSKRFLAQGVPVISVDSKKKEMVGEYANAGREWQPKGKAVEVLTYDFPDPKIRKAIPYGVYDLSHNNAFVNVGIDHDTPHFAVCSIEKWWASMGSARYPKATELFITADAGGSNSYLSRVWKAELQKVADRKRLTIHVSHFPPGTSKWNKIEHRLFSFITLNWRGRPLTTYKTIVSLIAATTTTKGLRVKARLDQHPYPLGIEVTSQAWQGLALKRDSFHGDWNYTIQPRTPEQIAEANRTIPPRLPIRRRAFWEPLVREQQASGMNSTDFCRMRDIPYSSYIRWRKNVMGPCRRPGQPNKL
jgi:hypothetical protein